MLSVERCTLPDHHTDFFTGSTKCSYKCSNEKACSKFGIKFTGLTNSTLLLNFITGLTNSRPLVYKLYTTSTSPQSIFEDTGYTSPAKWWTSSYKLYTTTSSPQTVGICAVMTKHFQNSRFNLQIWQTLHTSPYCIFEAILCAVIERFSMFTSRCILFSSSRRVEIRYCRYLFSNDKAFSKFKIQFKFTGSTNSTGISVMHFWFSNYRFNKL